MQSRWCRPSVVDWIVLLCPSALNAAANSRAIQGNAAVATSERRLRMSSASQLVDRYTRLLGSRYHLVLDVQKKIKSYSSKRNWDWNVNTGCVPDPREPTNFI